MGFNLNDEPLLEGRITFPRSGAWYATVAIQRNDDTKFSVGTLCTLKIDDAETWVGTVTLNASNGHGQRTLNIVGGGASMSNESSPRNQPGPSLQIALQELMRDATNDALAPLPPGLTGIFKGHWQSAQGLSVGAQISKLVGQSGYVWRVSQTGLITFSAVDFLLPAAIPEQSQLSRTLASGARVYAVQVFDVVPAPGTVIDGTNIEEVEITFDGRDSTLTLRPHSISTALDSALQGTNNELLFSRSFPGKVVNQIGQKLDIDPDDSTLKGTGLGSVPITFGIPGVSIAVSPGTRVRFCYDAADPARPRICAFEPSTGGAALLVTIGDTASAQLVALSNLVNDNFTSLRTWLNSTAVWATPVGPTSPGSTTPISAFGDVACTRLKTQ